MVEIVFSLQFDFSNLANYRELTDAWKKKTAKMTRILLEGVKLQENKLSVVTNKQLERNDYERMIHYLLVSYSA